MSDRQIAATAALALAAIGAALALAVAVQAFPRGLVALACLALAAAAAWHGLLRTGAARVAGLALGAVGLAAAVALVASDLLLPELLAVAAFAAACAVGRGAFAIRAQLPTRPPPRRPVLFFNPKSGGGKAARFGLAREARARGIEPIALRPGDDLERLVRVLHRGKIA